MGIITMGQKKNDIFIIQKLLFKVLNHVCKMKCSPNPLVIMFGKLVSISLK